MKDYDEQYKYMKKVKKFQTTVPSPELKARSTLVQGGCGDSGGKGGGLPPPPGQVDSHGRWKGPCLQTNPQCDPVSQHQLHHVDESTPTAPHCL
jgi:hypothetical protein